MKWWWHEITQNYLKLAYSSQSKWLLCKLLSNDAVIIQSKTSKLASSPTFTNLSFSVLSSFLMALRAAGPLGSKMVGGSGLPPVEIFT